MGEDVKKLEEYYQLRIPYPPLVVDISKVDIGTIIDYISRRITKEEYIKKIESTLIEQKVPQDKIEETAQHIAELYRRVVSRKITKEVYVFRIPYAQTVILDRIGLKAVVDYLLGRISFRQYYRIIKRYLLRSGIIRNFTSVSLYLTTLYVENRYETRVVSEWMKYTLVWFVRMKYDVKVKGRYVLIESETVFVVNLPYICWIENKVDFLKKWDGILYSHFLDGLRDAGFKDVSGFDTEKGFISAFEIIDEKVGKEEINVELRDVKVSIGHDPQNIAKLKVHEELSETMKEHMEEAINEIDRDVREVCNRYVV